MSEDLSIISVSDMMANTQTMAQLLELYGLFYGTKFFIIPDVFHSVLLSLPSNQWMLAICNTITGRVIGFVNAMVDTSFLYGGKNVCVVSEFMIHPDFQKQGIGSWALQYLEHYAKRASCKIIRFCSMRSSTHTEFFQKNGYTIYNNHIAERVVG